MAKLDKQETMGLVKKLGISEEDIREQHKKYFEKYSEGHMTMRDFLMFIMAREKDSFAKMEPSRKIKAMERAENIFNVFDGDKSGTMEFMEFMMASHATKLRWTFSY